MADDPWKKVEMGDAWNFEENPELIGLYLGHDEDVGENHSNIYNFEVNQTSVSVWGSTVLDGRMKKVNVGEEVKITFTGMKDSPTRKGKQYKDFEVYHREPVFDKVS